MTKILMLAIVFLIGSSCSPEEQMNGETVMREVRTMLGEYEASIERGGLMAEFAFLDSSDDFFWVPPGFSSALSYDSVRAIVSLNAQNTRSISMSWDTLRIVPLSGSLAAYTGVLSWRSADTTGVESRTKLIETGVAVRREDGWKLLCGQTRNP